MHSQVTQGRIQRTTLAVTLRSGRELEERRVEKKDIEKKKHAKIGEEFRQHHSELAKEEKTAKMQQEQQVEKENLRKIEEVKAYNP